MRKALRDIIKNQKNNLITTLLSIIQRENIDFKFLIRVSTNEDSNIFKHELQLFCIFLKQHDYINQYRTHQ